MIERINGWDIGSFSPWPLKRGEKKHWWQKEYYCENGHGWYSYDFRFSKGDCYLCETEKK